VVPVEHLLADALDNSDGAIHLPFPTTADLSCFDPIFRVADNLSVLTRLRRLLE
jgi:hypothetical protein